MLTEKFIQFLADHASKSLVFEYAEGQYIPATYHLTEIKKVHQESLDCGGFPHTMEQTIVQLWLPFGEGTKAPINCGKALKIFEQVDRKLNLRGEAELFFEYGTPSLRTSIYQVATLKVEAERVVIKLFVAAPVCKPSLLNKVTNVLPKGVSCC
ncbi:MAG: DUF6428 family protein [Saprospiraceae bacterium]